jgi:DNA helicase II / ATP-dependent DNA helicase PcrA
MSKEPELTAHETEFPEIFSSLNDMQQKAVLHTDGPLLIIAGAGSGKTKTIVHRIAYLIASGRAKSWEILAVTFTNKAAGEMRDRVKMMLGKDKLDCWVSTFHSFCLNVLRRYGDKIGIRREFIIYDKDDQIKLIKNIIKEMDVNSDFIKPPIVSEQIDTAKNKLLDAAGYLDMNPDYPGNEIAKIYAVYEEALKAYNALDFNDLILRTIELFKKVPEVLSYYHNKYRYVMVDEYQDTNHAQYLLVHLLSMMHRNLCVVGDDDQSIYRWRGADLRNILDFDKNYKEAKLIRLEQNYRSTQTILNAANHLIEKNLMRKNKKLWTKNENGEKIIHYIAINEYSEAEFLVNSIILLFQNEGKNYGDCAILYRTHAQSRVIEEIFVKANIPYQIIGTVGFYQRKEIKDILAYLKLILNEQDNISLTRIINEPPRRIGTKTVNNLAAASKKEGLSIFEYIGKSLDSKDIKIPPAVRTFYNLISDFKEKAVQMNPSKLIKFIESESGYADYLKSGNDPKADERLDNIKELVSAAVNFEEREEKIDLLSFMDSVSLHAEVDNFHDDYGRVSIMTVHSAKGLEFPVVFISGLEENLFPHASSLYDMDEIEEERRLCYVAMTRAKKHLILTGACSRTIFGNIQYNSVSRFVKEIPTEFITRFPEKKAGFGYY